MTIDTSAEGVERMAKWHEECGITPGDPDCVTAALLRALVAERDHACARGRDEALARAAELARVRHLDWRLPHPDDARDGEVCDDESCCADIANAIAGLRDDPAAPTAYARGWREGAEKMREGAAKAATTASRSGVNLCPYGRDRPGDPTWNHTEDDLCPVCRKNGDESLHFCTDSVGGNIAAAIRALPLPEPQA